MNLPIKIIFGNGDRINYFYACPPFSRWDAAGTKLKKEVNDGRETSTTEYVDGFIYFEGNLDFFSTAEGYVQVSQDREQYDYQCVFQYKDHFGIVRLSYSDADGIDASTEIIEENNYYPFGLEHKGYNKLVNGAEYPFINSTENRCKVV